MREPQLAQQFESVAAADADRRRRPLADAVHRDDRGLLERRRIERGGRVRFVVLAEEHVPVAVELAAGCASPSRACPSSQTGIAMRYEFEPLRRAREIGLEEPLEFDERLVVEADVVELAQRDAGLAEAIRDRLMREAPRRASCA